MTTRAVWVVREIKQRASLPKLLTRCSARSCVGVENVYHTILGVRSTKDLFIIQQIVCVIGVHYLQCLICHVPVAIV